MYCLTPRLLELGMFERVSRVRKKKKSGEKDEGIKSKDGKDSPKSTKSKVVSHTLTWIIFLNT